MGLSGGSARVKESKAMARESCSRVPSRGRQAKRKQSTKLPVGHDGENWLVYDLARGITM